MKTQTKNSINRFGLTFLALCAALVWSVGCATQPHPDPLAGWQMAFKGEPNQAIEKDYQDYIQKLPARKEQFVISVSFLKDGTGQHAIEIQMGVNGSVWRHILIYDKENSRIKVIEYKTGGYRS